MSDIAWDNNKWQIVCRVCRQEKRVYNSACVNASICDGCMDANPNPELKRKEVQYEAHLKLTAEDNVFRVPKAWRDES